LGFDTRPVLEGPVSVAAVVAQPAGGAGEVDLTLGLDAAALDLFVLGMKKPAGTTGRASARLRLREGDGVSVESVDSLLVETPAAKLHGSGALAANGAIRSADLVTDFEREGDRPAKLELDIRPDRDG